MRWLSVTSLAMTLVSSWTIVFKKPPRIAAALVLFIVVATQCGWAQCDGCAYSPAADILGVHNDGGRGCAGCHVPHSGAQAEATQAGIPLWGQNATPSYGPTVRFGDSGNYVEVAPARVASTDQDIIGVLLCLSCHDGNLTPLTMMPSQSYARKVGFFRNLGRQPIPTFLDGDYAIDHPLGTDATITLSDGLVFTNGVFSVIPGSPYARFVANYGLPALAPGRRSMAYGVNGAGQPYLLCTTCHNQHTMSAYSSTVLSPIDGDGGGRLYSTYFFANGPYNPKFDTISGKASSTTQFCRQCHLDLANEGNNTLNIRTVF
jgi:hypothetical protein